MKPKDGHEISYAIRKLEIFRNLSEEKITLLANRSRMTGYDDGRLLYITGDPCETIYIVIEGGLLLYFVSEEGNEVIFSEVAAGSIAGEIELALSSGYLCNAAVCGRTRLLEIERKAFLGLLGLSEVSSFLIRTFAEKLHRAMTFAEGMALYPLETRLARLIIDLGQLHGRIVDEGILIQKPISQSKMGQFINASRPRVNAQLQAWKNEKLIAVRNHRIVITDKPSLELLSRHSGQDGERP